MAILLKQIFSRYCGMQLFFQDDHNCVLFMTPCKNVPINCFSFLFFLYYSMDRLRRHWFTYVRQLRIQSADQQIVEQARGVFRCIHVFQLHYYFFLYANHLTPLLNIQHPLRIWNQLRANRFYESYTEILPRGKLFQSDQCSTSWNNIRYVYRAHHVLEFLL